MSLECTSCRRSLPAPSRFCPFCGASLSPLPRDATVPTRPAEAPTAGGVRPRAETSKPSSGKAGRESSGSLSEGRFIPGSLLANRYRIQSLLGKGGMGEVYRADDLKLGQAVALKFLPESLSYDGASLARLYNEVRLARQVSHPNVCRVYDIGDVDGHHFLCMEYVDGEDLGSLLRRIGRLPADKAIEVSRQLCAGLAAAHDRGVLHRDLKPSNVMIDGRGQARIADFGLASLAGEGPEAGEEILGTPAYLAPEGFTGGVYSPRSDLFSLGLVLYELFTGKPAFQADSLADMLRLRRDKNPPTPRSVIPDLDPAVERVILRCLERDPRLRPSSASSVAAALPGGDPLAAALAAGVTPSPEMIAAAGKSGGLPAAVAIGLLVATLLGLLGNVIWSRQLRMVEKLELPKAPLVLADRAGSILERLGYGPEPENVAYGFRYNLETIRRASKEERAQEGYEAAPAGGAPIISFWYRRSGLPLLASRAAMEVEEEAGMITSDDPPPLVQGMVNLRLDPRGRLLELRAVPGPEAAQESGTRSPKAPDWSALLAEAELDPGSLLPLDEAAAPPVFCDSTAGWKGTDPRRAAVEVRVEAGALGGRPVWFRVSRLRAGDTGSAGFGKPYNPGALIYTSIYLITMLGGICLAWRNERLGRSDRRGAFRLGVCVFCALMLGSALAMNHADTVADEVLLLLRFTAAKALFWAGSLWVLYLAIEPYVRRRWPERIISWSRLLAGRWRDPLVGRDFLIGAAAGVAAIPVLGGLNLWGRAVLGLPGTPAIPAGLLEPLLGVRYVVWSLTVALAMGLYSALWFFVFPLVLQTVLRKLWLAVVAAFLAWTTSLHFFYGDGTAAWAAYMALWVGLMLYITLRFGLLASASMFIHHYALRNLPITSQVSSWYFGASLFGVFLLAGLAVFTFWTSLAGRPIFRDALERG